MERYNRAYRDPKSPLTPLTPLSSLNVFNFTDDENAHYNKRKADAKFTPSHPKRNAEHFLQIRNLFEDKQSKRTPRLRPACSPAQMRLEVPNVVQSKSKSKPSQQDHQQKQQQKELMNRQFRVASPIATRTLSPRTETLLYRFKVEKYCGLFQREEIDIAVFRTLVLEDLHKLGILSAEDQRNLLRAAEFAYDYY